MRELGGEDNVVPGIQRLVPKGTSCDVIQTFVLELSAEGIPETSMVHFGMGIDAENTDCWVSWEDSCRTPKKR